MTLATSSHRSGVPLDTDISALGVRRVRMAVRSVRRIFPVALACHVILSMTVEDVSAIVIRVHTTVTLMIVMTVVLVCSMTEATASRAVLTTVTRARRRDSAPGA
jgi:hypothetical protein